MSDSIHMPFLARNIHVTESTDPTLVGISGQVIEETRRTIVIQTSNENKNIAGGVYIFDNSKNAYAWFDESRIQWLTDRYSEPEISYFDSPVEVNNDSNKIYIK